MVDWLFKRSSADSDKMVKFHRLTRATQCQGKSVSWGFFLPQASREMGQPQLPLEATSVDPPSLQRTGLTAKRVEIVAMTTTTLSLYFLTFLLFFTDTNNINVILYMNIQLVDDGFLTVYNIVNIIFFWTA